MADNQSFENFSNSLEASNASQNQESDVIQLDDNFNVLDDILKRRSNHKIQKENCQVIRLFSST